MSPTPQQIPDLSGPARFISRFAGPPLALLLASTSLVQAQQPDERPPSGREPAQILVLGTFHFADAGLDAYKPKYQIDVRSAERAPEVEDLLRRLERFGPTRIAVEWRADRQAALDSAYRAFLDGSHPAGPNEREQLGFRLAQRLGHERIWAVDAPARWYDLAMNEDTLINRARRFGQDQLLARAADWDAWYTRVAEHEDSVKMTMTLREYLLALNGPASMRRLLSQYLVGSVEVGRPDDYTGADMRTAWYNRNLRIFTNLMRMRSRPGERILLIIGAGHAPILRHLIENAPEFTLVTPDAVLR